MPNVMQMQCINKCLDALHVICIKHYQRVASNPRLATVGSWPKPSVRREATQRKSKAVALTPWLAQPAIDYFRFPSVQRAPATLTRPESLQTAENSGRQVREPGARQELLEVPIETDQVFGLLINRCRQPAIR